MKTKQKFHIPHPSAGKLHIDRRGVTLAALTLALGTAIYLNWSFARQAPIQVQDTSIADSGVTEAAATVEATAENDTMAVFDPLEEGQSTAGEETANKNYGEAQLVSVSKDSGTEFFESARLARSKARDEALKEMESALKRTGLTQSEKEELSARLTAQINGVTVESDLETLIKAKGFADCVVVLDGDTANVTVMTENDALTAAEVTQIRDIILGKCRNLTAQGITVTEVK